MSFYPIAKKEFLENVRNAWIIAMTAMFLVLTVIAASVIAAATRGMGGGSGGVDIVVTISVMRFIAGFLLPILALMLGFGTLAGERESGSLALLVAQPVTRHDVVLGKFLGLFGVLGTSILVGIGGGGLIVVLQSADPGRGMGPLGMFVLLTLIWGAAWVAITLLASAFFARRGTAVAGSLVLWFIFSVVWFPLVLIVAASTGRAGSDGVEFPAGLFILELLNPDTVYGDLLAQTTGGAGGVLNAIFASMLPSPPPVAVLWLALAAWIALPYAGAYALFRARDV